MVKGIRLKDPPQMDRATEVDILSEIDVLREMPDRTISPDGLESKTRVFKGNKYHTLILTYDDEDTVESVLTVASTLESAAPELVKVFVWNEKNIVFSFPELSSPTQPNVLIQLVEELLRVTTFVISEYNTGEVIDPSPVERIKKYISLYIKW